jgi:hypothetical protein
MNNLMSIHLIGFLLLGIIQDHYIRRIHSATSSTDMDQVGMNIWRENGARNLEIPNPPRSYGFNLTSCGSKKVPRRLSKATVPGELNGPALPGFRKSTPARQSIDAL